MKKIIYSLMLLAGIQGFSQMSMSSYNPYNPDDVPVPIANGEVWTTNTVEGQGATLYFYINNSYDYDIYIKARVVSITNDDGNNFQFCFGENCVFSITEGNVYTGYQDKVTIPAGDTSSKWDKIQNENADGPSPKEFVFEFFRVDENGDEMDESVTVTYKYDGNASVSDVDMNSKIEVYPTNVKDFINITLKESAETNIINLEGKVVKSYSLNEGTSKVDLSGLASGIYFVAFNGKSQTVKIVKQ